MAASVKTVSDPSVAPYAGSFAALRAHLPGQGVAWLEALRTQAMARFVDTGFPKIRDEAWKYTDLRRLAGTTFSAAPADGEARISSSALAAWTVEGSRPVAVFVDGRFAPSLSVLDRLPSGITLRPLSRVLEESPALVEPYLARVADWKRAGGLLALNTAMMADGAVLMLGRNAVAAEPLQVVWLQSEGAASAIHPRLLVVADEGSEGTLVETFASAGAAAGFTNAVAEVVLARGARLRHVRLQEESPTAWHIGMVRLRLAQDAAYSGHVLSAGARLSRTDIRVDLAGRGAECTLDGVTLVRGRQHADVTTDLEHSSGDAQSRQMFKAVLDDQARSVFQGRVLVAKDAQRTNAFQTNRNLLLSRGARADSKPELIIHADDVKCSHGATVGDLDRNALFYLRARGIDEKTARAMLIEAFVRELIDAIPGEAVRGRVERSLSGWLGGLAGVREAA